MYSVSSIAALLLAASYAVASPTQVLNDRPAQVEKRGFPTSCGSLVVKSQTQVVCNEYQPPAYINGGATYVHDTSKTVGTTWTVGGDLGINIGDLSSPAGSAGFSASFSETTTVGDTTGSSEVCGKIGGRYTCGMDVQPKCWHMKGICKDAVYTYGQPEGGTVITSLGDLPWENTVPVTSGDQGEGVYTQNICTCKNCLHWAQPGHPAYLCPQDCATCDITSNS